MSIRVNLGGTDWVFAGFHGEDWRFRQAYKRDTGFKHWLPATVPGSVHWDLLKAGEIPDPYFEQNSRLVEWVHQRQWVYKRDFTVPPLWDCLRLFLLFEGIDYDCEVYLDGELLGEHHSMFLPARFDITAQVKPGESHHLAVVIKDAPREWPQLGRTSSVHTAKARFGYWWDFATRLVHLGIWQDVWLQGTGPVAIEDVWVRTRGAEAEVTLQLESAAKAEIRLLDPAGNLVGEFITGGASQIVKRFVVPKPRLWWPNGMGEQPVYRCAVRVSGHDDICYATREVTFGFRTVTLERNPWPPAGVPVPAVAEQPLNYTFTVNGHRLFVKGWNWVPIDHLYGRSDLTERYEQLIAWAKAAGVNLLRVWGGGLLERKLFYDLCDQAGILVWQEFYQSSSGTDNVPPDRADYLALLEREALGAIRLRRNHPSLALWCGGNELTDWEKRPATVKEPALAMLARVVAELDPDRPFLPTSPSGPIFGAADFPAPEDLARQHDLHGPWHYRGPVDSYLPYNASRALFHSEFGTQGAVSKSSLDRFIAPANQWPPNDTNPNWVHHGAWWMQQHRVRELFGEGVEAIEEYLLLSQFLQMENLRYGVESNRRRWPACSGAVIWQLNEPWPNSHCTTAVDYYLRPKMAYYYVKNAYAPVACSLQYEGPILKGGVLRAAAYVVADQPFTGMLRIRISDPGARVWHQGEVSVDVHGAAEVAAVQWILPAEAPDVVICTLTLLDRDGTVLQVNPYLFSRAPEPIFASLRKAQHVALSARREGDQLILRTEGPIYAFFPVVDIDDHRYHWLLSDNAPLLAPGEEVAITVTLRPRHERADTDFPRGRPAGGPLLLRVAGWNVTPLTLTWEV